MPRIVEPSNLDDPGGGLDRWNHSRRVGAVGLLKAMRQCPHDIPEVPRHTLPFR
jgi:hypothetical protein